MGLSYTKQQAKAATLDEHAQMICNALACPNSFNAPRWIAYWQGMYEGAKAAGSPDKAALALSAMRQVAKRMAQNERDDWAKP